VTLDDQQVPLRRRELAVLTALLTRAGKVVPKDRLSAEIFGFAIVLVATTILPLASRPGYLIGMGLAGIFLLYHVMKLTRSASPVLASRLLHASVLYLPVVLGVMIVYKH